MDHEPTNFDFTSRLRENFSQAAWTDGRRVLVPAPVDVWFGAARNPSSSSERKAAERLIPPRLAHALTDMKSEAERRTVTIGSPFTAFALLFVFNALIIWSLSRRHVHPL